MSEIRTVVGGSDLDAVRALFREYVDWVGVDLSFQHFAEELTGLPGGYAEPGGVLLLASVAGEAAGCIAVRRWDAESCEMKRLFVPERQRGRGLGEELAHAAIEWSRRAGYARMLLDTLPAMTAAQRLYERLGFREIPPYRFNPVAGARFMELALRDPAGRASP
jgi:ribosomal protein S18 acetylase RimI-like enzyme